MWRKAIRLALDSMIDTLQHLVLLIGIIICLYWLGKSINIALTANVDVLNDFFKVLKSLIYINVVFKEKRSTAEISSAEDKFLPIIRAGYVRLDLCHSRIKILNRILQMIVDVKINSQHRFILCRISFIQYHNLCQFQQLLIQIEISHGIIWCFLLSWKLLSNTLAVRINKQFEMVCRVRLEK